MLTVTTQKYFYKIQNISFVDLQAFKRFVLLHDLSAHLQCCDALAQWALKTNILYPSNRVQLKISCQIFRTGQFPNYIADNADHDRCALKGLNTFHGMG